MVLPNLLCGEAEDSWRLATEGLIDLSE